MDKVLKQLEEKIETLLKVYETAGKNEAKLSKQVEELEAQLAAETGAGDKIAALEKQRNDLGKRLEKVLSTIDDALRKSD